VLFRKTNSATDRPCVSAAQELVRPALAMTSPSWPDLNTLSDQDTTDARPTTAAHNAEIVQALSGTVAMRQFIRLDRDLDRIPWMPLSQFPVPAASPACNNTPGGGMGAGSIVRPCGQGDITALIIRRVTAHAWPMRHPGTTRHRGCSRTPQQGSSDRPAQHGTPGSGPNWDSPGGGG
jgi:hypothetical protein